MYSNTMPNRFGSAGACTHSSTRSSLARKRVVLPIQLALPPAQRGLSPPLLLTPCCRYISTTKQDSLSRTLRGSPSAADMVRNPSDVFFLRRLLTGEPYPLRLAGLPRRVASSKYTTESQQRLSTQPRG
ncbi:unnamed protein product [Ectocarpus sp. 8 AP-2014]